MTSTNLILVLMFLLSLPTFWRGLAWIRTPGELLSRLGRSPHLRSRSALWIGRLVGCMILLIATVLFAIPAIALLGAGLSHLPAR